MKNRFDEILSKIRAARAAGRIEEEVYYLQAIENEKMPDFTVFSASKKYDKWLTSNQRKIDEIREDRMILQTIDN